MDQGWSIVLQIILLGVMLGIAIVIKLNAKFLQKHLIPTSMIAGFLGLGVNIIGEYVFDVIIFDKNFLGTLIYHLMGIGFISMALKERKKKQSKAIFNTGFAIINTYAWQGIIGFALSLLLVKTIFPDLFPLTGMMLPLSFAQGPGQANNIGMVWEEYGFTNGGNVGLTLATLGFLWAFIGGIPLINILSKRRKHEKNTFDARKVEVASIESEEQTEHTITIPKSIYVDDFTVQIALIAVIYATTYGLLTLCDYLLPPEGFGKTLMDLFWGFNFLFGTLLAILAKKVLNKLKEKNIISVNYADNYLLQKISSGSFDVMITAGIAAISISALSDYLVPILIISTVGGLFTMFYTVFLAKRIYDDEIIENIAGLYGMWTGTITTGVALLREVDPEAKTSVTDNLVLGSGFAAAFAVPIMLILNVPVQGFLQNKPSLYILTFVLLGGYSALMIGAMFFINKKYKTKK